MSAQLLIQRVTNGIIVSEVVPGSPSIDLSAIAVFTAFDKVLLDYLSKSLAPSAPTPAVIVRELEKTVEELNGIVHAAKVKDPVHSIIEEVGGTMAAGFGKAD